MTPTITKDFYHFDTFPIDPCESILVNRYKSSKTGLVAIHADIQGPLVSGFLTLATKVTNNDGCPHILEHLVFLGSEKYPYKGTLDSLAPRAYAPGTNAWTDIDHTCYTITTAGSDGFLQLLPVYVDHILFPTLTDEGFYTEVHHIDPNGEDAGVVYCEMQARENSMNDIMQRALQQLVYPQESGYPFEAGGLMKNLRAVKIDTIRDYHRQFYTPDNLRIIITGKLDRVGLLSTLEQIDIAIMDRQRHLQCLKASTNPWIPAPLIPDLAYSQTETVYFPESSSTMGNITVTWLGPRWNAFLDVQAIHVLNAYLSESPISPLKKLFVEQSDPYCTELDFQIQERSRLSITAHFQNVPLHKADLLVPKLVSALEDIYATQAIDMDRMKVLIYKEKLKFLDDYETCPTFMVALPAITASLYGDVANDDFINALQQAKYFDILIHFTKQDWLVFLKQLYIDTAYTAVIGKPSDELSKHLMEQEAYRIEKQRTCLGEKGLRYLDARLKHATHINETQIPSKIMEGFPIPSVSSISSIHVVTANNPYYSVLEDNQVQAHINRDGHLKEIPYFIQYDHIPSAFVNISVYLNTGSIPSYLKPYGRMYMDTVFASPMRNIDYTEVVQKLDMDVISYDASLGYQGSFREYIVITIKVESTKYAAGINWLRHLMWSIQFTQERLIVAVNKTLHDIPQAKRNGKLLTDWTMRAIHTDIRKSTEASCSYLYQDTFLPRVLKELLKNPGRIIQDMNEFRSILCRDENLRVHVTGDVLSLKRPKSIFRSWKKHALKHKHKPLPAVVRSRDAFGYYGLNPGNCTSIVILPSTESSFSIHSTRGPSDFDSIEIPSLLVLMEMLHAMEGIYSRLVRGLGLAYRCWLTNATEAGLISLCILRSTNITSAFEHIKHATHQLATGETEFDCFALEGAKSSVIFDMANCENTRQVAAGQSFMNKVLKQSTRQKLDLLKAIQQVTMPHIVQVLLTYILPLFDPKRSNHVIVTSQTKSQEVAQSFCLMGHPAKVIQLEDVYAKNIFQQDSFIDLA
ncbi:Metalloenzyme, LuxS/M16 peptidase-like protein [Gilbertella persicaria]|uniref:Metalloenzyme, LuxS/M16 peptidase-like protein n=1 Tax=Gilbertella persicaria TaxID=101096 RepID=UPI0022201ED3|nr:Metalloenzyme, LuxS/M16 peptidase-like protein [Gilbertella persicaria]KAI8067714.1 Metalloenzyme, LuxS/M16 peptidase-like protein [Gilbertella persicaria]